MSVAEACNLRVPNDLTVPPRRRQPAEFCPPSKLQAPTSGLPFPGGARKGSSRVAGSVGSANSTLPFLLQLRAVVVIMPSRNRETVDILHSTPRPNGPPSAAACNHCPLSAIRVCFRLKVTLFS